MHVGEKIKILRLDQGLSQENVAYAIGRSVAYVSRLERGEAECDNETIAKIKKLLNIENAPLLTGELEMYQGRIWAWNALVTDRRIDEAKKTQETLASILDLPYEHELIMLYQMIAARILVWEWNTSASKELETAIEEKINAVEYFVNDASAEARILYYRNKGMLNAMRGDNKNSVKCLLKAADIKSDKLGYDTSLYAAVGNGYMAMGRYVSALKYFGYAKDIYKRDYTNPNVDVINLNIGVCYVLMKNYTEAMKILEAAFVRMRNLNTHAHMIAFIAKTIGVVKCKLGDYEEGIKCFDESLAYPHNRKIEYVSLHSYKARALHALKKYDECEDLFQQARILAEEDDTHAVIVETFRCLTTLKDSKSIDYLESISLPFFGESHSNAQFDVLDICEALEPNYRKRCAINKANAIAAISRDIYMEMIKGRDDLD